jgi:hypothetical protein
LQVLGTQEAGAARRGAWFSHPHPFVPDDEIYVGVKFVGALGVVMTLMGISGLVLWLPKKGQWRRAFLVRRGARGLPLNLDLHHAAGIWTAWRLSHHERQRHLFVFPQNHRDAVHVVLPSGLGSGEPMAGFTPYAGSARCRYGGRFGCHGCARCARRCRADARAGRKAHRRVSGDDAVRGRHPAPDTGHVQSGHRSVSYVDDPRYHGMAEKVVNLQNALHYGAALGMFWKVMVFVSGFLPLFFAITGFNIWWARRR